MSDLSLTVNDDQNLISFQIGAAATSGLSAWIPVTTSASLSETLGGRYLIDATAGAITITMPLAATMGDGIVHTLKRIDDGNVNIVSVVLSGADTFDGTVGDTTRTLAAKSQVILSNDGIDKILIG